MTLLVYWIATVLLEISVVRHTVVSPEIQRIQVREMHDMKIPLCLVQFQYRVLCIL